MAFRNREMRLESSAGTNGTSRIRSYAAWACRLLSAGFNPGMPYGPQVNRPGADRQGAFLVCGSKAPSPPSHSAPRVGTTRASSSARMRGEHKTTGLCRATADGWQGTTLAPAGDGIPRGWQRSARGGTLRIGHRGRVDPLDTLSPRRGVRSDRSTPDPGGLDPRALRQREQLPVAAPCPCRARHFKRAQVLVPSGIDVSRVAHRLGTTIEAICAATGSAHVDVVG